jgi:hypothetical protein
MEKCGKADGKNSSDENHDDSEHVGEQAIPRKHVRLNFEHPDHPVRCCPISQRSLPKT